MDLIYTNVNRDDVGILKSYTFDLAYGTDENDFELTLDLNEHCCDADCILYIEGTEYGGIIDTISVVTDEEKLIYRGRTWQGIFGSKVIVPDEGNAYLTVSGEANAVIGNLIERLGLSDLFVASKDKSGLTISNYSFGRFVDGYSGIIKMLDTVSGKLKFTFADGQVTVSALPIVDYSNDEQFDNDSVEMEIEKTHNPVNHLICLGKGELTERQVIHLYMDGNKNISKTRTFSNLQEVTAVFDYPNAESLDELEKKGTEKFQEIVPQDKVQLNFSPEEASYDIGDIIGARELITNTLVGVKITKKIVNISYGETNIQYKAGE